MHAQGGLQGGSRTAIALLASVGALETGFMDRRLHPGEETRGEGVAMTRVACIVTSMAGLRSLLHGRVG